MKCFVTEKSFDPNDLPEHWQTFIAHIGLCFTTLIWKSEGKGEEEWNLLSEEKRHDMITGLLALLIRQTVKTHNQSVAEL